MKKCCVDNCQDECVTNRRYCEKHYNERKKNKQEKDMLCLEGINIPLFVKFVIKTSKATEKTVDFVL